MTTMSQTIGIVIPFYSGSGDLHRALRSCSGADCVTVVSDGSPEEAQAHQTALDCGARFLPLSHQGVSDARLDGALSTPVDWILFLDADDFLLPGAVERWRRVVASTDSDIVFGSHALQYGEEKPTEVPLPLEGSAVPSAIVKLMLDGRMRTSVWGCCIRRSLIVENVSDMRCALPYGEDMLMTTKLLRSTGHPVLMLPAPACYCYRVHTFSAMRTGCMEWSGWREWIQRMKMIAGNEPVFPLHCLRRIYQEVIVRGVEFDSGDPILREIVAGARRAPSVRLHDYLVMMMCGSRTLRKIVAHRHGAGRYVSR